jgi:WD40 repeat protein/serine/threonine protein kinase
MRVRQEDTGEEIPLDGDALGRGGEAAIYAVPNRPQLFAKVYHKPTGERGEKLAAMLAAPPDDPMAKTGHPSIAWPTARLLAPGVNLVVGYLMPRIEHGRCAIEFYNPRMRQQLCPLFHYRYLVRTAHNLAVALHAVHERGYVVGDLNESNVLVTNQALVALVDTDSFQVHTPNRLFRCRVGKPEYTPPELQNARFTDIDRLPEHDAFGLAVLIFQLLMQGTHPFAGMQVGEGEAGTIARRIAEGFWPYSEKWEVPVRPSPHAPPWEVLPPSVQVLMRRCFEDGRPDPSVRPPAAEWQRALQEAEQELKICAVNGQHHYHRGLATCPWCTLAQQQGRDPFPSLQELRAKGKSTLKMGPNGATPEPPPPIDLPPPAAPGDVVSPQPDLAATLRHGANQVRERFARVGVELRSWSRSRLLATGGVGAVLLLLLVFIVPRLWSYLVIGSPPVPNGPPGPPPRVEERIVALKVCSGHTAKVNAIRFLGDGAQAISGANDNTLRLWDLKEGLEVRRFTGHQSWILGLAVSAGGRLLVSGSADKTLRTWDVSSAEELHKGGCNSWINAVALSADGRRALTGGDDRRVRLWDTDAAQLEFTFMDHTGEVTCVAITPDGRFGLSGDANGDVLVWDLERRRLLRRLEGHSHAVTGVAFTARGAVTTARDRSVRLWDVEHGIELRRIDVPAPDVTGSAVSADSLRLLTVSSDGTLRLWDMVTGEEIAHTKAPGGGLRCVTLTPDGLHAITGGEDGVVRHWRLPATVTEPPATPAVPTLNVASQIDLRGAPNQRFFFLPDNRLLMLGREEPFSIRELSGGAELLRGRDEERRIAPSAVSRDGRRLVVPDRESALRLRDLTTGTTLHRLLGLKGPPSALALPADGRRVFYTDEAHSIFVWNPERPTESRALKGHSATVTALATTPGGETVLSASADGTARLWNAFDGRVLRRFPGVFSNRRAAVISADGRFAAILSDAPMPYVLIWDLEHDRRVRYLPNSSEKPVKAVYLSDTGEQALTVEAYGLVHVWEPSTGTEIGQLAVRHEIAAATFAGNMLITVDTQPTVRRFVLPDRAPVP